jgi:hypothetical protein
MINKNGLFVTNEQELINNSWNLLLKKSPLTALEEHKQKQKEIIRGIFGE